MSVFSLKAETYSYKTELSSEGGSSSVVTHEQNMKEEKNKTCHWTLSREKTIKSVY